MGLAESYEAVDRAHQSLRTAAQLVVQRWPDLEAELEAGEKLDGHGPDYAGVAEAVELLGRELEQRPAVSGQ